MGVFYPQCRAIVSVVLDGFDAEGSESDPVTVAVIPREARIHRNRYHAPDTWELTFDAANLPIDPQLVRTGAVEIYMYQTDGVANPSALAQSYSAVDDSSVAGRQPGAIGAVESGRDRRGEFTNGREPQIAGLFDEHSMSLSDDGKWVTITGQDYTALLASIQWKPLPGGRARRIPTGKPLDTLVSDLVLEADPSGRLTVEVRGITDSMPIVGKNEPEHIRKRGIPIETGTTYWDVIYKTVTRHGFICFVQGLKLIITRPRSIEDLATASVKKVAWGANLESLELSRNLGKQKVPRIIMVSYNPDGRELASVEYPEFGQPAPIGTLATKSRGGGVTKTGKRRKKTTEDEYQIHTLFGVSDPAILKRAAENLFRLLGRSERRMVATTRDLRDMEGSDMLNLYAGDAVSVQWQDFDESVVGNENVAEDQKVQHMVDRGINPEIAKVIARHYTKFLAVNRPLRFREGTYDWSVDTGIDIEMDLVDFVVVDGTRGNNTEPTKSKLQRRLAR